MAAPCLPGLLDPILHPVPAPAVSLVERLADLFRSRRGEWIDGLDLSRVAGRYAWRSRVSDLRKPPFNMPIANRQRRVIGAAGQTVTLSEYRYEPSRGGDALAHAKRELA